MAEKNIVSEDRYGERRKLSIGVSMGILGDSTMLR